MSAKTSPARRVAFFKALRETGNQTLACERAKVSRSWVQLQRSTDPQFKADVAAAVAEAKASLSQRSGTSPEHAVRSGMRPPPGWGFQRGEELVVRGSRGRRVQVARARLHQCTPRVEARILSWTRKPPTDGTTHWSTRRLGERLGLPHTIVARYRQA